MTKEDLIRLYVVERNNYDIKVFRAAKQPDTDVTLVIAEAWVDFTSKLYSACEQYYSPKLPGQWGILAKIYTDSTEDFVALVELMLFA